jgi:hypothetical protein
MEQLQDQSPSLGTQLLADIRSIFEVRRLKAISSRVLINDLIADPEKPWADYKKSRSRRSS